MKKCKHCSGKGRVPGDTIRLTELSYRIVTWRTCGACAGRGEREKVTTPEAFRLAVK